MSDTNPAAALADGLLTVEEARAAADLPVVGPTIQVEDRAISANTPIPFHPYWAVREELLPALARASTGAGLGDLAALGEQFAAGRSERPTAGGVAVITLRGVITPRPSLMNMLFGGGGTGLESFRRAFRDAVDSEDVGSILIDIDSPGGSTDLIAETAAEILAARGSKPIVAIANTMAASAAYWIASAADEVVVTPSGEVGSIGVFSLHEEYSKMDERIGITTTIVKAGKYKAETNPYEPLSEEAREAMQESVDEFHGMFLAAVAKGRGVSASTARKDFGEGRVVTAKKAVAAGMADRVATFEETVQRLASGRRSSRRASVDQGAVTASEQTRARDIRALQLARPRHL